MVHFRRLALIACISILFLDPAMTQSTPSSTTGAIAPASAMTGGELRPGFLDLVLLFDKSLSMASCIDAAKAYVAGKVLGPILVPGDRLIVELVYGRVERLTALTIATEADKAAAVRAVRSIKANGRYTDLGAALDAAKKDLDELGQPERPKYVLLITDERQEAPKGSPYQATDYKLKHPSLEYIKRVDLGKFRVITVGLQVGAKVDKAAPAVMDLLSEPPPRELGAPASAGGASTTTARGQGSVDGQGGSTAAERALPSWLLFGAAGLFLAALAGLAVVLVLLKSKRKAEEKAPE